jgi:catechol 2,3-dioxygenase-like lactoylglutathione lyase family enzyme
MVFEHFAINVPNARDAASWYVAHLGLKILRALNEPPYTHFLADDTGRVMLEIYTNETAAIPDYASEHPLRFHFAFIAKDAVAAQKSLLAAGATTAEVITPPDGSILVMMRDPWGVPVQLCQRANPF